MLTPVDVFAGLWLSLLSAAPMYGPSAVPVPVMVRPVPVVAAPADVLPEFDTAAPSVVFPSPAAEDPAAPVAVVLAAPAAAAPMPMPRPAALPRAERSERAAALLELSDEDLMRRIEADPTSIGSLSIGQPGSSVLFNAVELPDSPRYSRAPNAEWWATEETVEAIQMVVGTVHQIFPDTQPIIIGDISRRDGGRIQRHESHQGGRDVDFGFYYREGSVNWWAPGSATNMDLPRNWALLRALVTRTDVEVIFLDTRVQRVLWTYATEIGEDPAWLDRVFQFRRGYKNAIVQHIPNHRTHYHVRFYSPIAQELARRAHPMLVELEIMKPAVYTVKVVARSGQSLGALAARYGTSVRAIQAANGLSSTQIRAGQSYRIPVRAAAPPMVPLVMPHRTLPPLTPPVLAAVDWPTDASLYGSGQPPRPE